MKGFKDGVKDGGAGAGTGTGTSADAATPAPQVTAAQKAAEANTVDVEAKTKP